jgi:hypothetical protein
MRSKVSARAETLASGEHAKVKDLRWWRSDEPHVAVFANVERLGRVARQQQTQDLYYACLYDDSELANLIQGGAALSSAVPQTMTTNICRRQVDTYVAKMTKNRPVPMALTTGGDYGAQRRAKALTKFFEGVLDSVGYWKTRTLRLRDGAIFGSGFARNFRVGKKLFHERKFPWEFRVDPIDAMHGRPRSLYIRHHVDRLVLIDRYPQKAELIQQADSRTMDDSWDVSLDDTSDVVLVEEAIHLPSSEPTEENAKDGAWALCISNATLDEGDYIHDYHPISKSDYSPPLIGWRGQGMVSQLAGLQFEVNSIGLRLQEQGYMTGSYCLVPMGSGIETDTLDNGTLSVVRYEGQEPKFVTPSPWHPQFFDYYQKMRGNFAADITGISGLSSRSEKPAGLDSGKALRTYHDIDAENLIPQGREDERDAVDTAWQLFDLMEEIHDEAGEHGEKYVVKVEKRADGRSAIEDISYDKVRMDREEFTLRTFPTSFLASTPEDRWQQVSEMADKGLFSQDEMLALLDFPDVQRVLNLRGSPRRAVERIIERFLDSDDPKPIMPEPTMNLDIVVALGTLAYLEAKWIDEVPEKNTAALLEFVLAARTMRDATGGPQGGAQAPGELPPGPDDMAPVNAPGMMPPGPAELYAPPPDGAPLPGNAVAPVVMPPPGAA